MTSIGIGELAWNDTCNYFSSIFFSGFWVCTKGRRQKIGYSADIFSISKRNFSKINVYGTDRHWKLYYLESTFTKSWNLFHNFLFSIKSLGLSIYYALKLIQIPLDCLITRPLKLCTNGKCSKINHVWVFYRK